MSKQKNSNNLHPASKSELEQIKKGSAAEAGEHTENYSTPNAPEEHQTAMVQEPGYESNTDASSPSAAEATLPEAIKSENAGEVTSPEECLITPATIPAIDPPPASIDFYPPILHCIATLFKLHGRPITPQIIASGLPGGPEAQRPSACLKAAENFGFESSTVSRPKIEKISNLTLPCILLLQKDNACILTKLDKNIATVIFPEHGETEESVTIAELEKDYLGYAVFARLQTKLDNRASKLKLLKSKQWFWGTLLNFMPIYKHVLGASLIINLLTLCGPLFFMNVYDRVVPNGMNAIESLWTLGIGVTLAYIFDFVLRNLRSYFVDVVGRNADVILASRLMQHILHLRLDAKPDSTGSLANNLREFESLREFFSSTTLIAIIDLPFLIIFLAIIFFIGGPIILVPLLAIPLMICISIFMQFPMQKTIEKGFKENMQKNALLVEIINGLETIKTSMAEGKIQRVWEKVIGLSALSNAHAKRMVNLSLTSSILITQLVSVGVIITGVYLFCDNRITMGGIIACNILAGRAMAPLSQIAGMLARLQQSRMALKALDALMQLPTENVAAANSVDFGSIASSIQIENLFFKYPETERFALENITLNINPGEKIGIIGTMGSGKSTLGRMCVGLYQPTEGAVKIGGIDIRQLDTVTLRSKFGYVSQDNYLFYGTVRENIAFGAITIDDRMILRAANIAGVSDFVRNSPLGFGMQVGERGMSLSGGQRQSIAIARALLNDPSILIMDEPSSNMDNSSENRLKHRLGQVIADKTVIIITHRLSMLDLVDRLIVMDQGKIYADGPKNEVFNFLRMEQLKALQAQKAAADFKINK